MPFPFSPLVKILCTFPSSAHLPPPLGKLWYPPPNPVEWYPLLCCHACHSLLCHRVYYSTLGNVCTSLSPVWTKSSLRACVVSFPSVSSQFLAQLLAPGRCSINVVENEEKEAWITEAKYNNCETKTKKGFKKSGGVGRKWAFPQVFPLQGELVKLTICQDLLLYHFLVSHNSISLYFTKWGWT